MRVTVRLNDSLASHVDAVRHDDETSDAEAVRECIRRSLELDAVRDDLDRAEARVDELENQLAAVQERQEQHDELVEYVEEEKSIQQRREERRQAPAWRRAKWWLFGMDDE
jgi:hypothetical protein